MRRLSLLVLAAALAACATSPLGRKQFILISDDSINQQGITSFQQMQKEMPQTKDARKTQYVRCIADNITRQIPNLREPGELAIPESWEVSVFESEDVNAFALPGGG